MSYNVGGLRLEQPFRIRRIGHFGYHSPALNETIRFLTRDLGFAISDEDDFTPRLKEPLPKEDATGWFLRCGSDHHTLVVGSQKLVDTREPNRKGSVVGQISWQVGSLNEVVNGLQFLEERTKIRRVGRDAPGSNWHAYVYDPDGYINEVFYGMEQVGWDGYSKPEAMYDRAFTQCPELPQIPEFQEVANSLKRGDALAGYRFTEPGETRHEVEGILMPQPFKITRLGTIALFVKDMAASLAFYQDLMGLKISDRKEVNGHECVFLRADDEHHTLALYPKVMQEGFGIAAATGFSVASYQQLVAAREFLGKRGVKFLDLPRELTPGIHYGFWIQGPDHVAMHIYYGMERIGLDGKPQHPAVFPMPASQWPEEIKHGGSTWYDPPFMGPLA